MASQRIEQQVNTSYLRGIVEGAIAEYALSLDPARLVGKTILNGKYYIELLVSSGGMGAVFKAHQAGVDRTVALKILLPHLSDEQWIARFWREAMTLGKIERNINIVTIYDANEVDVDGKTVYCIAMEWVDGFTIAEKLEKSGPFDPQRTANILRQVVDALQLAHDAGIVHRDIKPSNIMLVNTGEKDEQVKIVDFGIAKVINDVNMSKTATQAGTPVYASPEQSAGEPTDKRSDIFSLGVVLYEMLTGSPRLIRKLHPDIPNGIEQLINRMLSKDPDDRPQSANEVFKIFSEALDAQPPIVFISFHPRDQKYYEGLCEMLKPAIKQGLYEILSEQDIAMGTWPKETIDAILDRVRIGIIIASAYYPHPKIFSDRSGVMCQLISKAKSEARMFSLFAGPVEDDVLNNLNEFKFKATNQSDKYLAWATEHSQQMTYYQIAKDIKAALSSKRMK